MSDKKSRVHRWLVRLNESDHVLWLLFVISFLETIIVPIPIELILVPYMVANRDRLWRTAAVVTAGCLAASVLGYAIGYFLFETAGQWAIDTFGWQAAYDRFDALFGEHGFWAILAVGVIPIPFQIATLVAGAAAYSLPLFALAATIARGIRYFGLAGLVAAFGERAERLWKRRRWAAVLLLVALLAAIYGLTHWLGSALV